MASGGCARAQGISIMHCVGIWGRTASEWPCRSAVESDAGRGSVECVRVDRLCRGVGCARCGTDDGRRVSRCSVVIGYASVWWGQMAAFGQMAACSVGGRRERYMYPRGGSYAREARGVVAGETLGVSKRVGYISGWYTRSRGYTCACTCDQRAARAVARGRGATEATHVVAYGARVETCGYISGWYTRPWGYTCDQRAACAVARGRGAIHVVAYDARETCQGSQ